MAIQLTEPAARHIRRQLNTEGNTGNDAGPQGLRIGVRPTGCSGYMYVVEPAAAVNDDDTVYESLGVNIVVDAHSLKFLDGTEIDFRREGLNEGLHFNNPNVAATCGCGESFTVEEA